MSEKKADKVELAEAESQVRQDCLETELDGFGEVRIYHPSFDEEGLINKYYSTTYNRLLKEESDLPTYTQLAEILEERGAWTDKHEEKIAVYKDQIRESYTEMAKNNIKRNKKNKKTIDTQNQRWKEKIFKIMSQYENLLTLKAQMFSGTVEEWTNSETLYYKMSLCVKDEKDKPIWKTPEDLKKSRGRGIRKLMNEAVSFWSGVADPLFVESLGRLHGDSDTEQV